MTEETLFAEALELPTENRSAFLNEACGNNAELRERVEILLRSLEEAGTFLAKSAEEEFEPTLDILIDDSELLSARSAALRKSFTEKKEPVDHEPPSKPVVEPGGKRVLYFGDYELQGEIARGAMGVVYCAEQKSLKRTVAIKMIRSTMLANDADVARFKAEAEAAASLDHPNIVPIYEVGMHEEQHYFTMKLIEGGTLRDHLERLKKDSRAAATLMSTVAGAIHTAHQRGILHRDLKPGNILVDEAGEPHVTDFGLAKQMQSNSSVTLSGQIMGTPQYMAPEQAEGGGKELTTAADVYGLGAMFYEMLCGRPPHVGASLMDTLKLVAEEEAAPPSKYQPKVERDLETIAMKCLDKDPAKRYASSQGLKNDLDRWLRGEPIEARPVGAAEKAIKWMKRKPMHAAAAGLAVLFLLTLGIGGPIAALNQSELRLSADSARNQEAEARERADASATLAVEQSTEIRKTLYASEMQLALAALDQSAGALRAKGLLNNWRPEEGQTDFRGWEWFYLRSRLEQSEWILPHPGSVKAAVWSADSKQVFTGCEDGSIRFWDAEIGQLLATFPDHESRILGLALTSPGDRLASLAQDGALQIRNLQTGELVLERKLAGGNGANVLAWSPDSLRLLAEDGPNNLVILDPDSGETIARFEEPSLVHFADWHPDGERFAITSGNDLVIHILATGESLRFENRFLNSTILDVDWDTDGNVLVSGHGCFFFVDPNSGEITRHSIPTTNRIISTDVDPLSGFAASVALDRGVYIYDPKSRETLANLNGHTADVHDVAWSPDGRQLLSTAGDGVRIWRFQRGEPDLVDPRSVNSLQWRPESGELAMGKYRKIVLASAPGFSPADMISHGDDLRYRAVWSGDGERIAVASDLLLSVWERSASSPIWEVSTIELLGGEISDFAWEPGGERLIAKGSGNTGIFSTKDGTPLKQFEGTESNRFFAWHPEGGKFAISERKRIYIQDADTGTHIQEWSVDRWVKVLAWSPDGNILATARDIDFLVELWELPGAKKIGEISGASLNVSCLAWSPDSQLLAIGALDNTIQLWSAELERVVLTFRESGPVQLLDWDDSGTRLAISVDGEGGGVRVRDAGRGYLVEDSPRSLTWIDQHIGIEPFTLRYRLERAKLLEKLGHWESAAADWALLQESRPGHPDFTRRHIEALLKTLDPAEAITKLETQLAEGRGDSVSAGILAYMLLDEAAGDGWISLEIDRAVSEHGAILLEQPDGSLFATGENSDFDVYRVTGRPNFSRVTAIRLEAIPDERLPKGGSGRNPENGTFHLGDISIETAEATIEKGWADYHYSDGVGISYPIELAFDDDPDLGWDPHPRAKDLHVAVFELFEPIKFELGGQLTIRLQSGTRGGKYPKHNLGRFRLSVADQPNAARLAELQQRLTEGEPGLGGWKLLREVRLARSESTDSVDEALRLSWAEAAKPLKRLFHEAPTDSDNWLVLAATLLMAEEEDNYEQFRIELLEHAAQPADGKIDKGIKAALLRPASPELIERLPVTDLAEELESSETPDWLPPWQHAALALVALRSGDFEKAEEVCQRALELGSVKTDPRRDALLLAIRALALANGENRDAAHASLHDLEEFIAASGQSEEYNWLIAEVLRREAEALLAETE